MFEINFNSNHFSKPGFKITPFDRFFDCRQNVHVRLKPNDKAEWGVGRVKMFHQ